MPENKSRFSELTTDRPKGPGDFARDDRTAEKAKAERDRLTAELQGKQITVTGDFKPEQFPGFGVGDGAETVWLEGGPLDGRSARIRRGAASHEGTAANPDPMGNPFVSASYTRTRKFNHAGLVIFQFAPPVGV